MLVFVKLGGSLITDKTKPYTICSERLDGLASQISKALKHQPGLKILIGHGSGSFGHQAAIAFNPQRGLSDEICIHQFAEIWFQASALNRLVIESLRRAGLPAITISPFSGISARDNHILDWEDRPIRTALEAGFLPVIHGDIVFDESCGGSILSTEDLFIYLARRLSPNSILLAGLESGVWHDYPLRRRLVNEIRLPELKPLIPSLGGAEGTDVTGGMRDKVQKMMALVEELPSLDVFIFSGMEPGNLLRVLAGEHIGTRLHR